MPKCYVLDRADFTLITDGGNRKTNPGPMYGSWKILIDENVHKHYQEIDLGPWGTNNAAEYLSLIRGLESLLYEFGTEFCRRSTVHIFTDSRLVANQVLGKWRIKAKHLLEYVLVVRTCLEGFRSYQFQCIPRKEMIAHLGH